MADTRRELSALQTLLADNTAGDISANDARDVLVSESPSFVHPTSAFASAPSTPVTGDLWVPTDSFYALRYSGSAWIPWGPLFPMTQPVSGDFAWINQGSASVSTTKGGILLSAPSNVGAYSWRIRKKAAPATPYVITACFFYNENWMATANNEVSGPCVGWRQSSDGKLHIFQVWGNYTNATTGWVMVASAKWTTETAISAYYDQTTVPTANSLWWIRFADDGTNRKISISSDGQNFIQLHSVGRTDFLTADEVLFAVNPYTEQVDMTLLSWVQT